MDDLIERGRDAANHMFSAGVEKRRIVYNLCDALAAAQAEIERLAKNQCPASVRNLIFYGAEHGNSIELSEEQVFQAAAAMGWEPRKALEQDQ